MDYDLLSQTNISWICHKCDSTNCGSFTFHPYEMESENTYAPLATIDSPSRIFKFNPTRTSSPKSQDQTAHKHTSPTQTNPLSSPQTSPSLYLSPITKSNPSDQNQKPKPATPKNHCSQNSTPSISGKILPPKKNLRVLNINCQHIGNKTSEFAAAVDYIKPDIICGTESWLHGTKPGKNPEVDHVKSSEVFPDGYTPYRNDRNGEGGGVFILVKNNLISIEKPQFVTNCEIVWAEIKAIGQKNILIGCFYMPKRSMTTLTELERSLQLIKDSGHKNIILAGDYNCPEINWGTHSTMPTCHEREVQQKLIDTIEDANLTQIHFQPTRFQNILDLVFVSNSSLVKSSYSVPGISDHDAVVTDLLIKPEYTTKAQRKCYVYAKANWHALKIEIDKMYDSIKAKYDARESVHELWNHFHAHLKSAIASNIPSMLRKINTSPPWLNKEIKSLLRKKAKLYNQAKKTGNWEAYRKHQRLSKKHIRQAEWEYINKIINEGFDKNNTKPFWKYVKSKKQDNIGISPLKEKGELLNSAKDKAQILLKQFKSVFTPQVPNQNMPSVQANYKSPLSHIQISETGVMKLLKDVNPAKAMGPDEIPNRVLKECAVNIAPPLTLIFQQSIDTGDLPDSWLKANVTSEYKKGDRHLPENYRPISLTCVISKLLEHIVCRSMLIHLEENNILTNLNHGFRHGYSCETQLLLTTTDLLESQNKGLQIDMGILDFSKAFDTVPHSKLLYKLSKYGVAENIHAWLTSFLTKRTMRVVVDGEASEEVPVISGVPQGTVLGPLLFLCHINDLPERVKSQVRLFADDCIIYREIHSREDHTILQQDLTSLEQWAKDWGMCFNVKKCHMLSVTKKRTKSTFLYTLENTVLTNVPQSPYLGIEISDDLTWGAHISKMTKKASSTIGFLKRNLRHCPISCRRTAYLSLVRSVLEYGAIIWDPYLKQDIERLEAIQRKGVRFITGNYTDRTPGCVTEMLKEQQLPTLQQRRKLLRLVFMFKVVQGLVPAIDPNILLTPQRQRRRIKTTSHKDYQTSNVLEKYVTRNSNCFQIPSSLTEQHKNSFFPRSIIDWNHLRDFQIAHKTAESFKNYLNNTINYL